MADNPSAQVDRYTVAMQESFNLVVEVPGSGARNQPDMTPVEENFKILRGSKSTAVTVIDGESQASTQFFYTLTPKRLGELQIPALQIDGASTEAITILVTAAAIVSIGDNAPDLFLEAEVNSSRPMVQSQVTYTMRLFHALDIRDGSLSEPELRDTVVIRLGDDVQYQVDRHQRTYQVVERRFAVFPEISGPMVFPPPIFKGQLPEKRELSSLNDLFGKRGGSSGNPFGSFFHPTRPITVTGPELQIEVAPVPSGQNHQTWLPAAGLELEESWSTKPLTFTVGEPTTRTVILRARGVTGAHLADFGVESNDTIKVYADRPTTRTLPKGDFIIGERKVKFALVPTRSGPFTLPAVVVEWWDTTSNEARTTELPARQIAVLPADLGAGADPTTTNTSGEPDDGKIGLDTRSETSGVWPLMVAMLFTIWLITFVAWLRARQSAAEKIDAVSDSTTIPTHSSRTLHRACVNNEAWQAKEALIAWAQQRWRRQRPRTLMAVATCASSAHTSKALMELDQILYDANESTWNSGEHLWQCLQSEPADKPDPKTNKKSRLPQLYPD